MVFRNRLLAPAIALVVVAITVFGCQIRDGSLPTEADRSLAPADQASDIYAMIAALIKDKGVGNSVNAQFKNVVKKYAKNPADGRAAALSTIDFIFKHYRDGKWSDPGGLGTGKLMAAIAAYVGLAPAADAAVACVPGQTCEINASNGSEFAGAQIQGDMITQPFILYLVRLPDDFADPPLYPLFYEIGTIPAGITFPSSSPSGSLSLAQVDDRPFAAVCALDSDEPLGTPTDADPGTNLFLSHFEGGVWVQLPYVDPGSGFLECADAGGETESAFWMRPLEFAFAPALAMLSPSSAIAGGRGLGGAISSFSPFGAEYTGLGGPVPTTTTVEIVQEGTTFFTGDEITIVATVTPAPFEEEEPRVVFNLATVGPPAPTEPVEDGAATHTFTCGEDVPYGSHTGGAGFLGTTSHLVSVSGQVLAFDCVETGSGE